MSDTQTAGSSVLTARFNTLIRPYLLFYVAGIMLITVVFIPLLLPWFCGVGQWWARHYFDKLECVLGDTVLRFRKGIIFQVEKTIPLENIQDVTFVEGPLLKHFHLSILKFETAGQSAGQAHNMRLIGLIDAHDFRAQLLARREALKSRLSNPATAQPLADQTQLLRSIDVKMTEVIGLLRARG
jgi:membrane protein YdbS with pleckstrin-like domain